MLEKERFSPKENAKKKPRIAVVFNLCNSGWMIQKSLCSVGLETDLYLSQSELETPSDPRWNDRDALSRESKCFFWNVYDIDLIKKENLSADRFPFRMRKSKILNFLSLIFFLHKNYDFVVGVALGAIPAYFSGKPFLWIAPGSDIREWVNRKFCLSAFLLKCAAKKSSMIFAAYDRGILSSIRKNKNFNVVVEHIPVFIPHVKHHGFSRLMRPVDDQMDDRMLVFAPASHLWQNLPEGHPGKGNDIFLRGVALFREKFEDFFLVLLDRGKDSENSKLLISELKLECFVGWREEMDKNSLHEFVQGSDVLVDQFAIGSPGTICSEAMALGKPVLIYVEDWFVEQGMPVLNCRTPEDVCNALIKCRDEKFRREIGDKAKQWIAENASYEALGARLKTVIFESLGIQETF